MILPPHRKVRSITYSTTEIPSYSLFNKSIRLDLRCLGEDGTVFIVEVQCYHQSHFFRRCVLYASKVYDTGSIKGENINYDIPPVYLIGLVDKDTQDFQDCSPKDGLAMGMAKGEAEGKIKGKIEEKTNIAMKMKKKGRFYE